MNLEEMKKIVIEIFEAKKGEEIHGKIIDDNTIYFHQHKKDGKEIIISSDGSYLLNSPSTDYEKFLEDFKTGKRSNTNI